MVTSTHIQNSAIVRVQRRALTTSTPFFIPNSINTRLRRGIHGRDSRLIVVGRFVGPCHRARLHRILRGRNVGEIIIINGVDRVYVSTIAHSSSSFKCTAAIVRSTYTARSLRFGKMGIPSTLIRTTFVTTLRFNCTGIRDTSRCLS